METQSPCDGMGLFFGRGGLTDARLRTKLNGMEGAEAGYGNRDRPLHDSQRAQDV